METVQTSLLYCDSQRAAGFILESGSGFQGGAAFIVVRYEV